MSSSVILALLTLAALLLVVPAAAATTIQDGGPTVIPTGAQPTPIALATTGLDITVPVIIGITTLILGIAVVAWAFLRTGAPGQSH